MSAGTCRSPRSPDTAPCRCSAAGPSVRTDHAALVLHSTTHAPPARRDRCGATIDWTWVFRLSPRAGGRTRLHLRVRGRTEPWWLTAAYQAAIVPADFVMATGMLRGIRRRVEAGRPARPSGRSPLAAGTSAAG